MFGIKKKQQSELKVVEQTKEIQGLVPITLELAEVSKGIFMSSKDLNECSKTLNEISHKVEDDIHINKGMIEKVKSEVHSINIAADEIHTHAKRNEALSTENLKNVEFSIKDLDKSMKDIEGMFNYFDEVAKTLEKLQTYFDNIGNITDYMDQIASKTSIVSINASIEAARAGEAGRGFMVITDEIKGLADQSKEFSNNINGMIVDMAACIEELNQISNTNREKIGHTRESISVLESNLKNIAQSTSELDKNIQSTLVSSGEIKGSVEAGNQTVNQLMGLFNETLDASKEMLQAVKKQDLVVSKLTNINEDVKAISEKQVNIVLNRQLEEKLISIAQKVAAYEGPRDIQSLQNVAKKYHLNSLNYINEEGCFEAAANPKAIGFNVFSTDPQYIQFKRSSNMVQVYPLSRNLFTGDIIRYVSAKQARTKQLISVGFNLEALKRFNEMSMEQVEAI